MIADIAPAIRVIVLAGRHYSTVVLTIWPHTATPRPAPVNLTTSAPEPRRPVESDAFLLWLGNAES